MKTIFSLTALLFLFSCNTTPKAEPVDLKAEEAAIHQVMDTWFTAIDDRDIDALASVLAEDGVFIGTDPGEVASKDTIVAIYDHVMQMSQVPTCEFISEPIVHIQPDGKMAVAVQQYHLKFEKPMAMPMRHTFYMVKSDSTWLIEFMDLSFAPFNEQVAVMEKALADTIN